MWTSHPYRLLQRTLYMLATLCVVVLLPACKPDPWKNAPKPGPGANPGLAPGIFQANVNDRWLSLSLPANYVGDNTSNHYYAEEGQLFITRASAGFVIHPTLGNVPEGQWRLVIYNLDLDKLPIPFVYGETQLPDDYPHDYPIVWVYMDGYTTTFPWFELNETGNPGLLTEFRILSKENDLFHASFSGQYWDELLGYYGMVTQGEMRIQLTRP
jgi:hypothetical protein